MKTVAAVLGVALLGFPVSAHAETIQVWQTSQGWYPNMYGSQRSMEGLNVGFDIKTSTNNGSMYVVGRFCNDGSATWVGGMRVETVRPSSALATIRVSPGQCYNWGEHLPKGAAAIYIYVHRNG